MWLLLGSSVPAMTAGWRLLSPLAQIRSRKFPTMAFISDKSGISLADVLIVGADGFESSADSRGFVRLQPSWRGKDLSVRDAATWQELVPPLRSVPQTNDVLRVIV